MAFSLTKRAFLNANVKNLRVLAITGLKFNVFDFDIKKNQPLSWTSIRQLQSQHNSRNLILFETDRTIRHYTSEKSPVKPEQKDYASDSDSDDEKIVRRKKDSKGKYIERGNSDFWRRKMRTLHAILDVNNDGVVSYEDLVILGKKFSDLGHLSQDTSKEFFDVMKKTWEEQWGEITPYNLVTAEQFLTDMHHTINDKELVKKVGRFLPYFFKAVDTDRSGYLDLDQYKLFFRCLDLKDEDAAVSFHIIDINGDNRLTLKEFVKLGRDYFLTEDEKRISRMFWGPLIQH